MGNQIKAQGDITLQSGGSTHIRASEVDSQKGNVNIVAKGDISIEEGRQTNEYLLGAVEKGGGFLSRTKTQRKEHVLTDRSVASDVTGKAVRILSGDNVTIKGSNVVSDERTAIGAEHDVKIVASTDSTLSQSEVHHKKSGLMGSGFGVTIGTQKVDTKSQGAKESVSQSHVG